MKRNLTGFIAYSAIIGLSVILIMGLPACSTKLSSIMVIPVSPPNITVGSTLQFTATGKYSNGSTADITDKVTWESSNTGIVVSFTGVATGIAIGNGNITATLDGITSSAVILTVVSPSSTPSTNTTTTP